ncbi:MAG: TAXI family TRAP transporter solute-binding subunit [Beijerinckiaceae bacterium]
MKKSVLYPVVATLAVALVPAAAQAQNMKMRRMTIGTNPAGSVYYLVGGGLAKLWQEELKVRTTVQPHAGSSVYIPLVNNGEITLGLNSSLDSAMSYQGIKPYKTPQKNLRAIARFWILPYSLIVKASSSIRTAEDLKGKRVMVDIKPNIPLGNANRAILASGGLTEKDVVSVPSGGLVTGLEAVAEGRVDAAQAALGMPQLKKMHASVPGGIRVVELGKLGTDEVMNKVLAGLRTIVVKPAPNLQFITKDTKVGSFDAFINGSTNISPEDAYLLTKILHANWKRLQKDYPPLRGVRVDRLAPARNVIPYHEGAVRYYKEAGMWSKANEERQAQVSK